MDISKYQAIPQREHPLVFYFFYNLFPSYIYIHNFAFGIATFYFLHSLWYHLPFYFNINFSKLQLLKNNNFNFCLIEYSILSCVIPREPKLISLLLYGANNEHRDTILENLISTTRTVISRIIKESPKPSSLPPTILATATTPAATIAAGSAIIGLSRTYFETPTKICLNIVNDGSL